MRYCDRGRGRGRLSVGLPLMCSVQAACGRIASACLPGCWAGGLLLWRRRPGGVGLQSFLHERLSLLALVLPYRLRND